MTSVGAKPLSIALHTLQLVNLNLSSNDIGPDGGEAIALWLKDNKSVTSLDLHNNLFAYGRLHDEVEHMAMARDLSVTHHFPCNHALNPFARPEATQSTKLTTERSRSSRRVSSITRRSRSSICERTGSVVPRPNSFGRLWRSIRHCRRSAESRSIS